MMKRLWIGLVGMTAGMALLAGCSSCSGGGDSSSEFQQPGGGAPPGMVSSSGPGISSAPPATSGSGSGGAGSTASAGTTSDGEAVQSITGIIDSAGMGKYFVELENGQILPFHFTDADLSGLVDSMPGSPIIIYYTGTINGTDTSGITVISMATP